MKMRLTKLTLVVAALLVVGCQSNAAVTPAAHVADPLQNEQFSRRSPYAVMDSPAMRYAPAEADAQTPPWWYDRNDARLNVRTSTGASDTTTYTVQQIDRQQVIGGRVYDVYQRNLYSWRVGRVTQ